MLITTPYNAIFYYSLDTTVIMAELHELIRDFFGLKDGPLSSLFPVFALLLCVCVSVSVAERLISRLKTTTSRRDTEVKEAVVKLKGYRSHTVIEAV